jgi:hypothetical protein
MVDEIDECAFDWCEVLAAADGAAGAAEVWA